MTIIFESPGGIQPMLTVLLGLATTKGKKRTLGIYNYWNLSVESRDWLVAALPTPRRHRLEMVQACSGFPTPQWFEAPCGNPQLEEIAQNGKPTQMRQAPSNATWP